MMKLNFNTAYSLFFNKSSDDVGKDDVKVNLKHQSFNHLLASDTRTETIEGIEYAVYPAIMLKEAVVNGAFVDAEDLIAESWNGVPVTVNHPTIDGAEVSANHPEVLAKFEIGRVFNARVEDKNLKAEVWIDVAKANKKFPGLLDHMAKNNTEVSTGYFALDVENEGEFNGKAHKQQHKDIKPDHFALLPNDVGACSWADGCGIRVNEDNITVGTLFSQAINKIAGHTKKKETLKAKINVDVDDVVIEALKTLQSDLETLLTDGDKMTKLNNNCSGLTDEEKADLKFLREKVASEKETLKTQVKEKLGLTDEQLEGFSAAQLSVMAESKAESKSEESKGDKGQKNFSGRSNATKKVDEEDDEDYSDMLPLSINSLFEKDEK